MLKSLAIMVLGLCLSFPAQAKPRHHKRQSAIVISSRPKTWPDVLAYIQRDARRELDNAKEAREAVIDAEICSNMAASMPYSNDYMSIPQLSWQDY
jgi:hypothetical protein